MTTERGDSISTGVDEAAQAVDSHRVSARTAGSRRSSVRSTGSRRSSARRKSSTASCDASRGDPTSHLRAMQARARRRADHAMQAYKGALGELREEMHVSPFASWTIEQLQEFLVLHNVEVRGSPMLNQSAFVAILDKMFKGCTDPPEPPPTLTEDFKKRREWAVLVLQEAWFLKKSAEWSKAMAMSATDDKVLDPLPDGHLKANPLHSPRGVMEAAIRGRISEDTLWEPPSVELARRFEDEQHLRHPGGGKFDIRDSNMGRYCFLGGCGEQLDLWDEGKISQFAQFGAGVTSYFKLLKFLSWSFLVASFMVLPHILVNFNGDGITTVSTNTDRMSWTTVGNVGGGSGNYSSTAVLPFCDEEQYSTCLVDIDDLGLYYGCIDAFLTMFFLAGYLWVNAFIKDEFETIKKTTVTAGDFTVQVKNVPPDITEDEVSAHFSNLLNRKVVEVAIARDNRLCIDLYAKSGKLYHQRAAMRDKLRYIKTKATAREPRPRTDFDPGEGSKRSMEGEGRLEQFFRERKIRQLQLRRSKASRQIIHLAAQAKIAAKTTNQAVAAYVTFDDEMAAVEARVMYSGSFRKWLCASRGLRLKGKRIRVVEAPEPSTIIWENYGYGRCALWTRRTTTLLIAASFLTLSIAMSIYALYQNQQAASVGGTSACPADWSSLSEQEQEDAVIQDGTILHCLCADSVSVWQLASDDICYEYQWAKLQATWLVLGTSLMVAFTNAAINKITKMLGIFEKHLSVDQQEVAVFRRLVLLKFVNIGLTVLVTNSRRVINLVQIDIDYEEDFTAEWYRTLGSSLVLNILLNVVTPHLYWIFAWGMKSWKWNHNRSKAISQDALNNLTKGMRWEMSVRYAEITVIFAVCLAYSAGIPILLPIGAFSFVLFYWVEKALFVHFYLTPPQYSGKLTNEVISLIPYCLWVHVVFAFYMYGNGSIFPTDGDTSDTFNFADKLNVKAVQPLAVPFVCLSALIFERWLGNTVLSVFARVVALLTCTGKIESKKLENLCNAISVTYSRAVVRGILRGLPSYNILLNPKYKQSFGLSDSFARQHKRVGSVFMMVKQHPSILETKQVMLEERLKKNQKRYRGSPKDNNESLADTLPRASPAFHNSNGANNSTPPASTLARGDTEQPPPSTMAHQIRPARILGIDKGDGNSRAPEPNLSSSSSSTSSSSYHAELTTSSSAAASSFSPLPSCTTGTPTWSAAESSLTPLQYPGSRLSPIDGEYSTGEATGKSDTYRRLTGVSGNGDVESPETEHLPRRQTRIFFSGPADDVISCPPTPASSKAKK